MHLRLRADDRDGLSCNPATADAGGPGLAFRHPGVHQNRAWPERSPAGSPRSEPIGTSDLESVSRVLESVPLAMILLDGSASLRFASHMAQALLSRGDALVLDALGIVRCRDREVQRRFRRMIHHAACPALRGPESGVSTLAIPRRVGLSLAARVTPTSLVSSRVHDPADLARARVVMFLCDPERELDGEDGDLAAIFGLSPAEANVVTKLATGQTPQEIAEARSVSLVTVRNQLKSAQAKVGVCRQAELVSVVLRTLHT